MKLQRTFALFASLLLVVSALAISGCGNKTAQNGTGSAASDSMLSSTPVEQPQGQLQPQSQGTPDNTAQQATPAPAPQTQGSTRSHSSSSSSHKPSSGNTAPKPAAAPSVSVAAGTGLGVTMGTALTSETATPGTSWTGTLNENVIIGNTVVFPAGAAVNGVVAASRPAAKGDRAMLLLQVTSISANGKDHEISASADSMVAGSTTKRNVGAVAGGAAAGALIGKAMGGSGKSALIGGILGGAAATGAVAASKGFQVEVKSGKELTFHVDHDVKVKL